MALFRQGSAPYPAGVASLGDGDPRPGSPFRLHDHMRADQKGYVGLVRSRSIKKRPGRVGRSRKCSIGAIVVILLMGVILTIFGADFVFPLMRNMKAEEGTASLPDPTNQDAWAVSKGDKSVLQTREKDVKGTVKVSPKYACWFELMDDRNLGDNTHLVYMRDLNLMLPVCFARESYEFLQISTGRQSGDEAERASTSDRNGETLLFDHDLDGDLDANAKYWGSDGETRDRQNMHIELEDDFEILARSDKSKFEWVDDRRAEQIKEGKSGEENTSHARFHVERDREEVPKYEMHFLNSSLNKQLRSSNRDNGIAIVRSKDGHKGSSFIEGDSDPDGRGESRFTPTTPHEDLSSQQELRYEFEEGFEVQDRDDVEDSARSTHIISDGDEVLDSELNTGDENIMSRDASEDEDPNGSPYSRSRHTALGAGEDPRLFDFLREAQLYARRTDPSFNLESGDFEDNPEKVSEPLTWGRSKNTSNAIAGLSKDQLIHEEDTPHDEDMSRIEEEEDEQLQQEQLPGKTRKKRKRSIPPCEISFLNSTKALREPTENSRFASFSLTYRQREEKPPADPQWEPRFAGHQTLLEREESFVAKDQEDFHCGFVRGPKGYRGTGFEISKEDMDYLQTCHIAVSSCIFGNYDHIRNPSGKKVTSASKKKVCFAMFVDQPSLDGMREEGEVPDENMNLGLWRIVLIKNVPYPDNRRTGKVPKFLTHRLFPNARYSVWLDSKLRLQSDPLLILEYFLWRGHHEYAISNHYDRHCVWEEVEQNKKLNKYNHSVIDEQFAFYQTDGLPRFNATDPNKPLPSHVPEGSFIVRAHTPVSNLFSCLWFNEVDRFTPRDQLSFAYTYLKLVRTNPRSRFRLNMFKDCERKAIAKLYRHKAEDTLVKGRRH